MWVVLPAAILWGASFPLALAAVAGRGQDPGRLVGGVYAANTVGAIVGSLLFSMVVVPYMSPSKLPAMMDTDASIGTTVAQRLLIALSGVSAFVVLAPLLWPYHESPTGEDSAERMDEAAGPYAGPGRWPSGCSRCWCYPGP